MLIDFSKKMKLKTIKIGKHLLHANMSLKGCHVILGFYCDWQQHPKFRVTNFISLGFGRGPSSNEERSAMPVSNVPFTTTTNPIRPPAWT